MSKQALHEIFSTHMWDLMPSALHGYKVTLDENIAGRIRFEREEQRPDRSYLLSSADNFTEMTYVGNAGRFELDELNPEDRIINVINVEGAILRNGDACSYGSKEHRDELMRAADMPQVIGHIIRIDSPGGSAYSKFDYEQAIDYIHSKRQPVIALVDGMACSAGYAIAALCDEVYFVGAHDTVGCIGTMAAFYTQKDGDENAVSKERYVEVYATGSPNKNKEIRDAARGDYEAIQAEVDQLCEDYQAMVRKHRPSVTEEQLKGATYPAGEVIGTMVDGQGNMVLCIRRVHQLSGNRTNRSAQPGANRNESTTKNQTEMKEYPKMKAALGLEALVSDQSNGVYLNEELADAAEQAFASNEHLQGTLDAKMEEVKQLGETIANLKAAHEAELTSLSEAHQKAIEELEAAHRTAMEESDKAHQDEVTALSNQLGEAQQALESKEAEIKELSEATAAVPVSADVPTDNSVQGRQEAENGNIFKEGMSLSEKAEALKNRDKKLKNALR